MRSWRSVSALQIAEFAEPESDFVVVLGGQVHQHQLALEGGGAVLDQIGRFGAGESSLGVSGDQSAAETGQQFVAGDFFGEEFVQLVRQHAFGVQQFGSFLASVSKQLIALATEARLADMYEWPSAARKGELMGYGPDQGELYRQFYAQVWRILQGASPASLPFEGPMRVRLTLNMARARFLGLRVPGTLLARADEVIE